MMKVRETGKYLTYAKSTFHVRGSLRYVVLLGWPPKDIYCFPIILQLRPCLATFELHPQRPLHFALYFSGLQIKNMAHHEASDF